MYVPVIRPRSDVPRWPEAVLPRPTRLRKVLISRGPSPSPDGVFRLRAVDCSGIRSIRTDLPGPIGHPPDGDSPSRAGADLSHVSMFIAQGLSPSPDEVHPIARAAVYPVHSGCRGPSRLRCRETCRMAVLPSESRGRERGSAESQPLSVRAPAAVAVTCGMLVAATRFCHPSPEGCWTSDRAVGHRSDRSLLLRGPPEGGRSSVREQLCPRAALAGSSS